MTIIARMLTKMTLMRFIGILFGISIFVLTLETVSYSKEILSLAPGGLMAILRYMVYRAPAVLANYVPISLMLALLLTFTELSFRNEISAMWSSGISPLRLVVYLLPMALLCGLLHVLLLDRAIPSAAPTLRNWGIGDYGSEKLKVGESDPIWLRNGSDILRAGKANATATRLTDVVIFKRQSDGNLIEQVFAAEATMSDGQWTLRNAVVFKLDGSEPQKLETLSYGGVVIPAVAGGSRTGEPSEMTLGELSNFVNNEGFGIRPAYVYKTWWYKRFAPLAAAVLMVCLVVPLLITHRRGGGLGIMFAIAMGLGFLYFLVDGISMSAGELGLLPPFIAAWLPNMAFAFVALILMLRTERVN
jgi:lipopolysaccharide export system permease protein